MLFIRYSREGALKLSFETIHSFRIKRSNRFTNSEVPSAGQYSRIEPFSFTIIWDREITFLFRLRPLCRPLFLERATSLSFQLSQTRAPVYRFKIIEFRPT